MRLSLFLSFSLFIVHLVRHSSLPFCIPLLFSSINFLRAGLRATASRVHRLESGKFLMGYYGVHSAYQRDSYWYNTRATFPRLLDAPQETGSKPMPAHVALSRWNILLRVPARTTRTCAKGSLGDLAARRLRQARGVAEIKF